jgi:hypothetical protein
MPNGFREMMKTTTLLLFAFGDFMLLTFIFSTQIFRSTVNQSVSYSVPHLKVNFTLTDLAGRILIQSTRPELDISGLPTGMYLLRMRAGRAQSSIRVLKQ